MITTPRVTFSVPLLLAAALAACAGDAPPPRSCADATDCPSTARCTDRVCVANAVPVARLTPPAAVPAFALALLDGSRSTDPDAPGDSVVAHAWTVRAVDAPCAPPAIAGTGEVAQVRFACAGRYEVELVVTDELGAASAPAREELAVTPAWGTPAVVAGADVVTDHLCEGEPLRCRPATEDGRIPLSATVPSGAGITVTWTAIPPPGLPVDPARRVTFEPDGNVPDPAALIETDGVAISGDWVFQVEARDAAGVMGTGAMRVSVGNRPPVIAGNLPESFHVFDPVGSHFAASGAVELTVSDPDGDPLEGRALSWHHVGDGAASTFTVSDDGDRITWGVLVPYRAPPDALLLIGGEGLERSIGLAIRDANGAQGQVTWPIEIGNRPPVLASARPTTTHAHGFDGAAQAYVATATLSTWTDPDGDPLTQGAPSGDPACGAIDFVDGVARAACRVPFAGAPSLANLVGVHDVVVSARDPWAVSGETSTTAVNVLNRPPVVTAVPIATASACTRTPSDCCEPDPEGAPCWDLTHAEARALLAGFASDPDGDPLDVRMSGGSILPAGGVCEPAACAFELVFPAWSTCDTGLYGVGVSVDDGVAAASQSFPVSLACL